MKWYVYRYDYNKREIVNFNIFDHGTFRNFIEKYLNDIDDKAEFAKQVDNELRYFFWARSEYELHICPNIMTDSFRKIDIYDQVKSNFDVFIDYIWGLKR